MEDVTTYIHSETLSVFLVRVRRTARRILKEEARLPVTSGRPGFLLNRTYWYPSFVVFTRAKVLGFFEPETFRIGLHKALAFEAKNSVLKDILRHEIAHMLTHLYYGDEGANHGERFRSVCKNCGFTESAASATADLAAENLAVEGEFRLEGLARKVKKLLSLGDSPNVHEAQAALVKANELMLKHNLKWIGDGRLADDEPVYIRRVLTASQRNARMRAICDILETFLVMPVFSGGRGRFHLEVTGTLANVEVADYVAGFLDSELDRLYNEARQKNPGLAGVTARNSFYQGVAEGYTDRVRAARDHSPHSPETRALATVNKALDRRAREFYQGLTKTTTHTQFHPEAAAQGRKAGKKLSIHKGVQQNPAKTRLIGD